MSLIIETTYLYIYIFSIYVSLQFKPLLHLKLWRSLMNLIIAFTYAAMTIVSLYLLFYDCFCHTVAIVTNFMSALFATRHWSPISSLFLIHICLWCPRQWYCVWMLRRPFRYYNIDSISKLISSQHALLQRNICGQAIEPRIIIIIIICKVPIIVLKLKFRNIAVWILLYVVRSYLPIK